LLVVILSLTGCSAETFNAIVNRHMTSYNFSHAPTGDVGNPLLGIYFIFWSPYSDHVDFALVVQNAGWIGFGFSPHPPGPNNTVPTIPPIMIGSDAGIGGSQFVFNSSLMGLVDMTLEQQVAAAIIPDIQNFNNINVTRDGLIEELSWSRALDTGDPADLNITIGQGQTVVYSMRVGNYSLGDPPLGYHLGNRGRAVIDFGSGAGATPASTIVCTQGVNCNNCDPNSATICLDNPTSAPTAIPTAAGFNSLDLIGQNYVLQYKIDQTAGTIDFIMSASTTFWVGIGFNSAPLMIGSQAIVGWIDSTTNSVVIQQYYLISQTPSAPASSIIAQTAYTILNPTGQQANGWTTIAFTTYLTNGTNPISLTGITDVVNAYGAAPFPSYHGAQRSPNTINFVSNKASTVGASVYKQAHASLMFIAFGFIWPMGAAAARYLKPVKSKPLEIPLWFFLHRPLQFGGYAIGIAGFGLAIYSVSSRHGAHFNSIVSHFHMEFGLTVMILGFIQIFFQFFRPHPTPPGERPTLGRQLWELQHRATAILILVYSVTAIFGGIKEIIAPHGWFIAYACYVGVLLVLLVVGEYLRARVYPPGQKKP